MGSRHSQNYLKGAGPQVFNKVIVALFASDKWLMCTNQKGKMFD